MTEQVDVAPDERLLAIAKRLEAKAFEYERKKDSRCVFTYAYSLMTATLARELPRGGWNDREWVAGLAGVYSDRYIAGLDSYDQDTSPPGTWQQVLGMLVKERSSVLEDLVGIMAVHFLYDLPLALCDMKFTDQQLVYRLRDFDRINTVLCRVTDDIQHAVVQRYCPILHWLDVLGKTYDELLTYHGMRICRSMSWYNAIRLTDTHCSDETLENIGEEVVMLVKHMTKPPVLSLQLLLRASRLATSFFRRWPAAEQERVAHAQ
jgi:hypothetical protein